jgi:hypothetical protein
MKKRKTIREPAVRNFALPKKYKYFYHEGHKVHKSEG